MNRLEDAIGYHFTNRKLLATALTTPACKMSDPGATDNQRLEFLGDAVFGMLSADELYAAYPNEVEGGLTVRRTQMVSGETLAKVGEKLGLAGYLKLNVGAAPLSPNCKMVADAMEALMGAIWLDGGLEAAQKFYDSLNLLKGGDYNEWSENPKGYLQVLAQKLRVPAQPRYEVVKVVGPSHAPTVTVKVTVTGLGSATATAFSKRRAEVEAANELLKKARR